uniref:Ammonium_transp domain-containing protein n=1 Tax=Parastrongyloides trichosuri TaxID=131310 RepID=A0A0N4ZD74_PARTI
MAAWNHGVGVYRHHDMRGVAVVGTPFVQGAQQASALRCRPDARRCARRTFAAERRSWAVRCRSGPGATAGERSPRSEPAATSGCGFADGPVPVPWHPHCGGLPGRPRAQTVPFRSCTGTGVCGRASWGRQASAADAGNAQNAVQSPCNGKEQEQEQDHAYTDLLALQLHRLCHPVHEVGQVGHVAVVLGSSLGVNRLQLDGVSSMAGVIGQYFFLDVGEAGWIVGGYSLDPFLAAIVLGFLGHGRAVQGHATLALPHGVRHPHAWENQVIPACRTGCVTVERAQVGVDVVCAARTQVGGLGTRNHGQVRRSGTKPLLAHFRGHGDLHQITHLVRGEQQVFLDVFFGQADVCQLVVAHGVGAMTVQTVVHKQFCAILQSRHVIHAVGRALQGIATFGGHSHRAGKGQGQSAKQFLNHGHSVSCWGPSEGGKSRDQVR